MKKIKISQFYSGSSESEQNSNPSFNSNMGGFDIYSDIGKLIPQKELVTQTLGGSSITDYELSDFFVTDFNFYSSAKNVAIGNESSISTKPTLFEETSTEGEWQKDVTNASSGGVVKGTGVLYQQKPHILSQGGSLFLVRFDSLIATSTPTSMSGTSNSTQMFVHPLDDILYIPVGNKVYTWDGTTLYTGITLPADKEITSLTDYGGYLAIATKSKHSSSNSVTYLWGRDRSLNTLQEQIDFGTGDLMILENLGGMLVGVSYEQDNGYKLTFRVYSGGEAQVFKEIYAEGNLLQLKKKTQSKLYFAVRNSDALYCLYKNKVGNLTVTKSYFTNNGEVSQLVYGFDLLNNRLFSNIADTLGGKAFKASKDSNSVYSDTAYYETTQNPGMDSDDLSKNKQLKRVYVTYKPKRTSGVKSRVKLFYSVNGGDYVQILDEESYSGTFTLETVSELTGDTFSNFIEVKFKIESQYNLEILEMGYTYELNQTTI